MRLISAVEIKGFRSIRSSRIDRLGGFVAFAGLNNSGKSNVLRALNAFFNGETDEGIPLDVDKDYYRPDLRLKKAKEIIIAVTFSLPRRFKFRAGLEGVHRLLGTGDFTIAKRWRRNEPAPAYRLGDEDLDLAQRQLIDQFLQLIKFRYVPNRVLPIEVVRKEHQNLRDILVRRLGGREREHGTTFDAIRQTSETVIRALAMRLHEASPDIGDVRLATPTSWSDMVFAFGYKLGRDGIEMDDGAQGAGIQSLLMLETLYLIDRDYFQKFGWRQAAIWAVEEPESSLHTALEARVAAYLSDIASDSVSRLQVLCTTHSDLMLQYATRTFMVRKDGWETKCEPAASPQDAVEQMSREGISRWTHPILYYPTEPVILVEGKYDAAFLEKAFNHIQPNRTLHVTYLEKLEGGTATGGVDALAKYIRANVKVVKLRRKDSRVVVLLDWDSAGKLNQFQSILPDDDSYRVLAWPDGSYNPKLGRDFHGIERCFSDRLIRACMTSGAPIQETTTGNWVVTDKEQYGNVKSILRDIVQKGLRQTDLVHAGGFIRTVIATAEGWARSCEPALPPPLRGLEVALFCRLAHVWPLFSAFSPFSPRPLR
ncbi:MAG: AAA family ATPase [Chloroflexi bacterium]|nr:AAA family ATPase [Chloroflexota bacterium]